MTTPLILIVCIFLFSAAYRFYSPYIARWLGVEPDRPTPAFTMTDGVDYAPAKGPVLFGHHFASIAGAAPIVGPIVAAAYGWGPVLLWIIIGGIFLGSVHDFSALIASIHHHGRSMGEIIGINVGHFAKRLFLFFLWATLVLLIAVFLVIVAKTFVAVPSAATASALFILLAVAFGFSIYRLRLPLWIASIVGIIILTICVAIGWNYPLTLTNSTWIAILIGYIFIASVTPVWILLQPRDYLNSFLLYALLICAIVGIFVARPEIAFPAFITWDVPKLGLIFPILFVTVACGGISGFHSVVASGTTAKQISCEKHARPIAYGGMLVESLLAVLALTTVMILTQSNYITMLSSSGPVAVFSRGVGSLLTFFGIDSSHGTNFAALAVSAFVLTTLDTATRLCRFAFQEFFAPKEGSKPNLLNHNRFIGTFVTVLCAALLAYSGQWKMIWPIFGAANQLLAALALMAVSLWLRSLGRSSRFLRIPMVAMFAITLSALGFILWNDFVKENYVLAAVAASLLVLAILLVAESVKHFWASKNN